MIEVAIVTNIEIKRVIVSLLVSGIILLDPKEDDIVDKIIIGISKYLETC